MFAAAGSDLSPERAEKICEFARAKVAAGMHEAAFALFAQALQTFPSSEAALAGLLECGVKISDQGANSPTVKSLRKDIAQIPGPVGDFLDTAILSAIQPARKDYALDSFDRAFRADAVSAGRTLGERAFALLSNADRQHSDDYYSIAKAAFEHQLFDLAERAGQTAVDLDPVNVDKKAFHKNATAARIIAERKLEKPGTRFIHNLKDPATQQMLQAQERPISSADELEQMIAAARTEYSAKSDEKIKISKLVSLLEKRGQAGDLDEARTILTTAYNQTKDPSYRQRIGDLHLRDLEAAVKAAQRTCAQHADQTEAKRDLAEKKRTYLTARCAEFEKRAIEYPTEPAIRLDLGETLLMLNRYNEAIPHLQAGRGDMKQRSRAWRLLGMAFTAIAFWNEAAYCLEEALKHADQDPPRQLEAKLSLGRALLELYSKKPDAGYLDRAKRIILEVVVEDFTHPGAVKLRAMLAKASGEPAT